MSPQAESEHVELPVEITDEPILAWRCWFTLPTEGLLRPIYKRGLAWKPQETQEALCADEVHAAPDDACRCGIYSVCHPMLLQEVHWDHAPPKGVKPLPGIVVVGQVALWGKVIQHERGWRAQYAYPKQLYAFTDDATLAGSLRDRYQIPVAFGHEAARLWRLLPRPAVQEVRPAAPPPAAPLQSTEQLTSAAIRDLLLEMTGPAWRGRPYAPPVEAALSNAFRYRYDLSSSDQARSSALDRVAEASGSVKQARLRGGTYYRRPLTTLQNELRAAWRDVGLTGAEMLAWNRTKDADARVRAARRAVWVRLVRWVRTECTERFFEVPEQCRRVLVGRSEALTRGISPRTGQPYRAGELKRFRGEIATAEATTAENLKALQALSELPIPTYREWRR